MCKQEVFEFQDHNGRKVIASFDGGHLSSDGSGALLFRELELRTGVIGRLARCFRDERDGRLIEHSVEALLRQRIGALSMGYEDLNDHDSLRHDPAHGLMAGKSDIEGKNRSEADQGKALAGHSTLNRLEQSAMGGDGRYKKIIPQAGKIEQLLMEEGVKAIPRKSRRIMLDFDATDDPLHGSQEGRFFHGYYGHYCYLPLYCFCGNIPLLALLQAFALRGTRLEKATIGTLRLRLFKIAARVKVSVRRIRFELAEGCPDQDVFAQVFKNLQTWPS